MKKINCVISGFLATACFFTTGAALCFLLFYIKSHPEYSDIFQLYFGIFLLSITFLVVWGIVTHVIIDVLGDDK